MWNTELEEVLGTDYPLSVTGVRLKSTITGKIINLPVDGIFIVIGQVPQTQLFVGQLDMKPSGYIVIEPRSTATRVPGVFAAGDVADDLYRQAVTAARLDCMAAIDAEKYLIDGRRGSKAAAQSTAWKSDVYFVDPDRGGGGDPTACALVFARSRALVDHRSPCQCRACQMGERIGRIRLSMVPGER